MVKINKFEIENVKRVKAVMVEPTSNGLTIVGGRNGQGKTSVLDSITWALGGNHFKPTNAKREGSAVDPVIRVELDNGYIVERKGEKGALKVTDPSGRKAGQKLLDSFVETFAINLPKFLAMNSKEKTQTLLNTVDGLGEKLAGLENEEAELYSKRTTIGQIEKQKKHYAEELIFHKDVGTEFISVRELLEQQQDILARNGENERKRNNLKNLQSNESLLIKQIEDLENSLNEKRKQLMTVQNDIAIANADVLDLYDESTAELEESISNIEITNNKIRENQERERAEKEAEKYYKEYQNLTEQIESIRQSKVDLLNNANLPLEELSVEQGLITYKGQPWDNMSGSEQLIVATAIVRKLNPNCEFVLVDKLEQMDLETLAEFGSWLEREKLQAIATRVSTGDECQIIIEDGYVKERENNIPKWQLNNGGGF